MGLYDTVIVACPKCGRGHELQTKAGDCVLAEYNISEAPCSLLADLAGEKILCDNCKTWFALEVQMLAYSKIVCD